MEEEIIYTFILTKTDGTYLGWSKAKEIPPCGDTDNMSWVEWNKPLPDDIDTVQYKYENGELKAV
jgi:hypothetical protein